MPALKSLSSPSEFQALLHPLFARNRLSKQRCDVRHSKVWAQPVLLSHACLIWAVHSSTRRVRNGAVDRQAVQHREWGMEQWTDKLFNTESEEWSSGQDMLFNTESEEWSSGQTSCSTQRVRNGAVDKTCSSTRRVRNGAVDRHTLFNTESEEWSSGQRQGLQHGEWGMEQWTETRSSTQRVRNEAADRQAVQHRGWGMEQRTDTRSSTRRVRNGAVDRDTLFNMESEEWSSGQRQAYSVVTDHARRGRGSAIGASAHPPSCRESASCDQCLDGSPPATQNTTRVHFLITNVATQNTTRVHFLLPMLPHKTRQEFISCYQYCHTKHDKSSFLVTNVLMVVLSHKTQDSVLATNVVTQNNKNCFLATNVTQYTRRVSFLWSMLSHKTQQELFLVTNVVTQNTTRVSFLWPMSHKTQQLVSCDQYCHTKHNKS